MEQTISATEARVRFGDVIQRLVSEQQTVIVERSGKPQIVILSIARYERLKAAEQQQVPWPEQVRQIGAQVAAELGDRDLPPAETIIRQMRQERDVQLMDLR